VVESHYLSGRDSLTLSNQIQSNLRASETCGALDVTRFLHSLMARPYGSLRT
jgi:hypothetical protein